MLKYTLGALAAAVILLGTGFVVLAQVTDGGADQGPAPNIILSVNDEIVWPEELRLKAGEITMLSLQNHSAMPRIARVSGPGVEQMPEVTGYHYGHSHGPDRAQAYAATLDPGDGYIVLEASPGMGEMHFVRFNDPGEYMMEVAIPGVYFPPQPVRVVVE
jgi:hypothetical protein